jgi:hypothetical protein
VKLICVAAQQNNGKDVLADYLMQRLNERNGTWVRSAFANAVKEVYQNAFGVDRDFIEKWKRVPEPPPGMSMNVRKSLQFIGDGFRQMKDGIWIDIALRGDEPKILSDSRYINEAKAVREKGGYMIAMWRPSFENDDPNPSESQIKPIIQWCLDTNQDGPLHWNYDPELYPAPSGIEYYNYFMRNDGTLGDLYNKVEQSLLRCLEK